MRSHHFDAVLDRLLDTPEKVLVLGLKASRRLRVLSDRGTRWLQRHRLRLGVPSPLQRQRLNRPLAPAALIPEAGLDASPAQSFVLIRIVGNDLYPRHDAGQSMANLRFILEHESPLEGCEKRWLFNRIYDPSKLAQLTSLLDSYGYSYDVIPFEREVFQSVPWDWEVLPCPDFLGTPAYRSLLNHQRQSWEIALYRLKNNYLMNNNGARNRALELGRARANWVLPWDGNCFLTTNGWQALRQAVGVHDTAHYFHVPMQRIADNAQLLDPTFEADPRDEPQLLFAAQAAEHFNDRFPYGRRPKVELFWRLGLEGPWDQWPDEPWDQPRRPRLQPSPACPRAGWVARLHSGMRDRGAAQSAAVLTQQRRFGARNLAIKASINQALLPLDSALARSAFGAHWSRPLEQEQPRRQLEAQATIALHLLQQWERWWRQGAAPPQASQDRLVSAFTHLIWHAMTAPGPDATVAALLEWLGSLWFAEGAKGLQPRLRLLRRPLAPGRLPGTEPTVAAVLQLALLSDLLEWSTAARPMARAWNWWDPFQAWRDGLAEQLQGLMHPAWIGRRGQDLQVLQLVLALLQRHRGLPTEPIDALLRLLSTNQAGASEFRLNQNPQAPDPQWQELIYCLAHQHRLLDPELLKARGWRPSREAIPPLLSLQDSTER